MLREWLVGVGPDQLLFPKLARRRTWLMVKKDLERIGIPYETAEGIADFHAAGRHSHITGLVRNGDFAPRSAKAGPTCGHQDDDALYPHRHG